jgi:uncharacterized protein YegP (UPF0339 family)
MRGLVVRTCGLARLSGSKRINDAGRHAGKFEITKDMRGEYRFRLKSTNGQVIALSEGYEIKTSANKGIESIKKLAADATVVDLTE